jgi:cysteine desulfurase
MTNLYFNNAFSKQPLPEALKKMFTFALSEYENPLTESDGAERGREALDHARSSVAAILEARPNEIFFVSSGTEANNWALKGAAYAHQKRRNHLVISQIEHFSVYQAAQFLQRQGFEVTFLSVSPEGFVDPEEVANSIRPTTSLVSIQAASDEIGVIQNLSEIASLKQRFDDVLFHTDAVQFVCYEELSMSRTPLDLVSISSNALYGPAGVGALYIREGTRMVPLLHGGMQEDGMRPGLQSIATIAGFGEAASIVAKQKSQWKETLGRLQEQCFATMDSLGLQVTGSRNCRLVDNVHVIADVDGEALLTLLLSEEIRASSGSTCYQYAQKESHVLKAIGLNEEQARGSILFTLSKDHQPSDIQSMLDSFGRSLRHLRNVKP